MLRMVSYSFLSSIRGLSTGTYLQNHVSRPFQSILSNFQRQYSCPSKSMNASAAPGIDQSGKVEANRSEDKIEPKSGQVFLHGRHNMYVCWHPEEPFPYEMTKPIDVTAPITDSHLKIQALTPVKEAFRRKHRRLMIHELIKLTYSTKHRFFGRYGKKKRTLLLEMDPKKTRRNRKYL